MVCSRCGKENVTEMDGRLYCAWCNDWAEQAIKVECICIFPSRVGEFLPPTKLEKALERAAASVGNAIAICSKYQLTEKRREISIFKNDPAFGEGVKFVWHVPPALHADVASQTKAEWQALMAELVRHGPDSWLLLDS